MLIFRKKSLIQRKLATKENNFFSIHKKAASGIISDKTRSFETRGTNKSK